MPQERQERGLSAKAVQSVGLAAVEEHHIPRFQRIPLPLKPKLPRPGFDHEAKKRLQPLPPARMPPQRLQGAHLLQMKQRSARKGGRRI